MVFAIHDRQIAEHGGSPGIRDKGAVLSALARPINRATSPDSDAASLAAAYAFGLSRNMVLSMATSALPGWLRGCFCC